MWKTAGGPITRKELACSSRAAQAEPDGNLERAGRRGSRLESPRPNRGDRGWSQQWLFRELFDFSHDPGGAVGGNPQANITEQARANGDGMHDRRHVRSELQRLAVDHFDKFGHAHCRRASISSKGRWPPQVGLVLSGEQDRNHRCTQRLPRGTPLWCRAFERKIGIVGLASERQRPQSIAQVPQGLDVGRLASQADRGQSSAER